MTTSGSSQVVLLVDDDADIRDVISLVLDVRGYSVVGLSNGREALEWLRQGNRACVILLDLMMPEMNGWEFRQLQLGDPDLAAIPVVILSGIAGIEDEAEALRAETLLSKPIDLTELTQTVAQHC